MANFSANLHHPSTRQTLHQVVAAKALRTNGPGLDLGRARHGLASLFQSGKTEASEPAFVLLEKRAIPFTGTPPGIRPLLVSGEETPAELIVVTIEPAGFWLALPVP